jgi:hypothetical protein
MELHSARTAPARLALVSSTPATSRSGWRQTADAVDAAQEIHRALDAVLGNVALLVTQIDPGCDAHARARRALDEAKRIRDILATWQESRRGWPATVVRMPARWLAFGQSRPSGPARKA